MAEPLPICLLNGEYLALQDARISPLDRSFLYGDGIYEVMPVFAGRPFRFVEHFDRLARSLAEVRMKNPHTRERWRALVATLIERNGGGDQYIYLQVSRGAEYGRSHAPLPQIEPTVFGFCAPLPRLSVEKRATGHACITAVDSRWARCDIKSVSLLANVLLRQLAVDSAADETILLREGWLTDASASAVHIVVAGKMVSPPYSHQLLPGTTRAVTEELAIRIGVPVERRPVHEAELRGADEIWLSAATRDLHAVTRLDGQPVGTGMPGPVWKRVSDAFESLKSELAGQAW